MGELIFAESRFLDAYETLFKLVDYYPETRRERPGACGEWTPKQVLAHLSGWLVEADRRFTAFEKGDKSDISYADIADDYNAHAVSGRAHLNWRQTIAELRLRVFSLATRISNIPDNISRADSRYLEWMDGLTRDCRTHTRQLRDFLNAE